MGRYKIIITMTISLVSFVFFIPSEICASGSRASIMINDNADVLNTVANNIYIAAADDSIKNGTSDKTSGSNDSFQLNIHKYLGWTTIGMMGVTIGTGFIIPRKGHCALAGITTGFAVATCVDGIYEYGGLISITDGDWKYNTHAILGTLATAGFITTLALADGEAHVATGITSAAAFSIALAVIYF